MVRYEVDAANNKQLEQVFPLFIGGQGQAAIDGQRSDDNVHLELQ